MLEDVSKERRAYSSSARTSDRQPSLLTSHADAC
jgi:hypothetical protein